MKSFEGREWLQMIKLLCRDMRGTCLHRRLHTGRMGVEHGEIEKPSQNQYFTLTFLDFPFPQESAWGGGRGG